MLCGLGCGGVEGSPISPHAVRGEGKAEDDDRKSKATENEHIKELLHERFRLRLKVGDAQAEYELAAAV